MGIKEAIAIISSTAFEKTAASEKKRKAKEKTQDPKDYCLNPGDEYVMGEGHHFPIYDEKVARKSVAQVKGISEKPSWWDNEDFSEIKNIVIHKVKNRFPELKIDEIKPISGKKPIKRAFNGCQNCGFTGDDKDIFDTTFPCPKCGEGGAMVTSY